MQHRELKRAGLRATGPRLKVLDVLHAHADSHLSAEQIYHHLIAAREEVGLATVYRVLTQFEEAGLVRRHHFEGGSSVFELDAAGHHDHMICLETGKVIEFLSEDIERLQREIAESHGFDLVDHSLVLYVRPRRTKT